MRMSCKKLFVQNVDLLTSKQQCLISTWILKWNKSRSQMWVSGMNRCAYENQRVQQIKWPFWSFLSMTAWMQDSLLTPKPGSHWILTNWKPFHFYFDLEPNMICHVVFHLILFKDSDLTVYTFCVTNQFDVSFFEICPANCSNIFCHVEKKSSGFYAGFFGRCIVMFITLCSAWEIELSWLFISP